MESNSGQESLVQKVEAKKVGDTVAIFNSKGEKITLTILKVSSSLQEAERLGIAVPSNIPIYYLDKDLPFMDAGIGHAGNHIVMFPISDDQSLRHELIHSVELSHEPTQELLDLYEKVKQVVKEDSFRDTDGETYNFSKYYVLLQ